MIPWFESKEKKRKNKEIIRTILFLFGTSVINTNFFLPSLATEVSKYLAQIMSRCFRFGVKNHCRCAAGCKEDYDNMICTCMKNSTAMELCTISLGKVDPKKRKGMAFTLCKLPINLVWYCMRYSSDAFDISGSTLNNCLSRILFPLFSKVAFMETSLCTTWRPKRVGDFFESILE